jgi:hypothetical protein
MGVAGTWEKHAIRKKLDLNAGLNMYSSSGEALPQLLAI